MSAMTSAAVSDEDPGAGDALLRRALTGDLAAFGGLVRLHQRTVYSLGLRMLGDRHEAEDLAQEVFLQLHHHLAALQSGAHLVFWLRRVTMHRAIDRLRRAPPRHAVASLEEVAALPSETVHADPLLSAKLTRLVGQLPAAPRAVILLRYQEDMEPLQIARTLGMPINTVKSHLKRSLALLRERLGPDSDAAGGKESLI
jgi:RNA polymerase sigma-70 factor (ECF subfamily)